MARKRATRAGVQFLMAHSELSWSSRLGHSTLVPLCSCHWLFHILPTYYMQYMLYFFFFLFSSLLHSICTYYMNIQRIYCLCICIYSHFNHSASSRRLIFHSQFLLQLSIALYISIDIDVENHYISLCNHNIAVTPSCSHAINKSPLNICLH